MIDMEIKRKTKCRKSCVVKQNLRLDDKNYKHFVFYVKNPIKAKYQYLIRKRKEIGFEHHKYPRTYIEYLKNV